MSQLVDAMTYRGIDKDKFSFLNVAPTWPIRQSRRLVTTEGAGLCGLFGVLDGACFTNGSDLNLPRIFKGLLDSVRNLSREPVDS